MLNKIKVTSCDTIFTRFVGHAMNVWRVFLAYWISEVKKGTWASPSKTFFNTNPYHIIYISHTMYGRPPLPSYIFPKATRCVQWSRCTYNPIVGITWPTCSSPDGLSAVSTLLPFVLTHALNNCISASIGGEYYDTLWNNSILIASFNSCFIFSRLRLFSGSNSFLHSSLRLPIISDSCCWGDGCRGTAGAM